MESLVSLANGVGLSMQHTRAAAGVQEVRAQYEKAHSMRTTLPTLPSPLPDGKVPEMLTDPNGNKSLFLRATAGRFDFTPGSRCVSQMDPLFPPREGLDAAGCEAWCAATKGCSAAQLNYPWKSALTCKAWAKLQTQDPANKEVKKTLRSAPGPFPCVQQMQCVLYSHCLERVKAPPTARSDVWHQWGPHWPPGKTPAQVEWKTNATVVLVSYHASLAWLRSLPGNIVDLVVYHKADFGRPNITYPPMTADYVLSHLKEQEVCKGSQAPPSMQRLHHPSRHRGCPDGCVCGKRPLTQRPWLAYFSVLPNYGLQSKEPYGGSREPYGYLQFILDFWDNMPPVVIFSQDDCLARGCGWGMALPTLAHRLRHWQNEWAPHTPPSPKNCLCKFIKEDKYRNRGCARDGQGIEPMARARGSDER